MMTTLSPLHDGKQSEDNIKTIVEERLDEQGRKVKITRKIRMRLVSEEVAPEVAARRTWKKFGAATGDKPGPDVATTILGEPVFLKLSLGKDIDREHVNKVTTTEAKQIVCRFCSGAHWSAKCPFKETFADANAMATTGSGLSTAASEARSNVYVPPSLRNRDGAPGADTGSSGPIQRDQTNTIRLTNLSDMVTDPDVRDLCGRFGPIARAFVAKDQVTMRCKGYAYVTFTSYSDAEKAVSRLNGHLYGNLVLRAEWAKPTN